MYFAVENSEMGNCCSCPRYKTKAYADPEPYHPKSHQVFTEEPVSVHSNSHRQYGDSATFSQTYYAPTEGGPGVITKCVPNSQAPKLFPLTGNHHSRNRQSNLGPPEEIQHIAEREPESAFVF